VLNGPQLGRGSSLDRVLFVKQLDFSLLQSFEFSLDNSDTSSPVATGVFGGLAHPNKTPSPQIETRNTINQLSFCQFLECQAPPVQTQTSPAETQIPPVENFLATVLDARYTGYYWHGLRIRFYMIVHRLFYSCIAKGYNTGLLQWCD